MSDNFGVSCGVPFPGSKVVTLAHGGGGKMTSELIDKIFKPNFCNAYLNAEHDGAVFKITAGRMAFTTDSYVVYPHFFPGGDIGKLAVCGTVNDLAMCGATPKFLTCSLILEEGFSIEKLGSIVKSMQTAAQEANIEIVTGDTKVVQRGHGDGIYINTSGIGHVEHSFAIEPRSIREGDVVILSGDVGRHGMAILSTREGLSFESPLQSDCAPLWEPVSKLISGEAEIHCLRDLTRGGLATGLIELAESSGLEFRIEESEIQVCEEVRGVCEIFGLDPLYVANEGRFIAVVPGSFAQIALDILHRLPLTGDAKVIGSVQNSDRNRGRVVLKNTFGTSRYLDKLSGEQLPRIC